VSIQIEPLRGIHLEDAAELFCIRYRALRKQLPLMPARYSAPDGILPMLRDLAQATPGVVAIDGRQLAGFLLGFVIPEFLGARSVFSPEWANAARMEDSRHLYQEMYGRLSAEWVADRCFIHLVSLLENDPPGRDAWHWLGFGMAAVDGVRDLEPVPASLARYDFRRATLDDLPQATNFDEALSRHLSAPPTFWPHENKDYSGWLMNPVNAIWLAYPVDQKHAQGQALGFIALEPDYQGACQITQDQKTISITGAFTCEEARGNGVATALLNVSLEWARAEGYTRCAVDFEPMNSLAARFWPRYFQPVCYSLMRRVDERIGSM
jgi:GNAT superfamily N-acetyltransferase